MKKSKLGILALASILVLSGCGGNDKKEDGSSKEQIKQDLSLLINGDSPRADIKNAIKEVTNNFTLKATTLKDITLETVSSEEYDEYEKVVSVTDTGNVMYELVMENGAYYFDAKEMKNSKGYYSYASELGLDSKVLTKYDYTKTSNGWKVQTNDNLASLSSSNDALITKFDTEREKALKDIYFGVVVNTIYQRIFELGYEDGRNEAITEMTTWYDSKTKSYVVPIVESESKIVGGGAYSKYYSLATTTSIRKEEHFFPYYVLSNEDYGEWEQILFHKIIPANMKFTLNNGKITSLSYDIIMQDRLDPYWTNLDIIDDSEEWNGKSFGLHISISNIGTSVINLNSDVQYVRDVTTGKEISGTNEELDEAFDPYRTFFNNKNYTVSYKAEFSEYYYGFKVAPEYEYTLKVSENAVSVYQKYYYLGEILEEQFIIEKVDDTHEVKYTYDYSTETWFKGETYEVASGTQVLAGYYQTYWNNLEGSSYQELYLPFSYTSYPEWNMVYCDTLKSYIVALGNQHVGEDNYQLGKAYDVVFNINTDGTFNFYSSRQKFTYTCQEKGGSTVSTNGFISKVIDNVGTTTISIPQV